jgi:DeoR family fructose operon transcriptional repressor
MERRSRWHGQLARAESLARAGHPCHGNQAMLIAERQTRLRELLSRRGMCDLDTLSAELNVSQSTVRRDVEMLEQAGVVERTHGGVIWLGDRAAAAPAAGPYAFHQRMNFNADAKRRIAKAAAALIQPGQTLIIDGGTTTFYLAQELLGRPLQIVTNSLPIASLFLNDEQIELVLTGGVMYPRHGVLLGPMVETMLSSIHAKTLVLSPAGIHDGMLYNQNMLLVQAEQRMMEQAQEVVLLADSGKFGQQALSRLCPLSEIDVVVTDSSLTVGQRELVRSAGCELIVAEIDNRQNGKDGSENVKT